MTKKNKKTFKNPLDKQGGFVLYYNQKEGRGVAPRGGANTGAAKKKKKKKKNKKTIDKPVLVCYNLIRKRKGEQNHETCLRNHRHLHR